MQFTSPVWSQARGALAGCIFRSSSGRLIATARAQKPRSAPRNGSWQYCFAYAAWLWTHKTKLSDRNAWSRWAVTAGFSSGREAFMHWKPYHVYIYFFASHDFDPVVSPPSVIGALCASTISCIPSPVSPHGLRIYLSLNNKFAVRVLYRYVGPFSPTQHTFRSSKVAAVTETYVLPAHYTGYRDFTKMIAGRRYFFTIWAYEGSLGHRAIRPVYCDGIAG